MKILRWLIGGIILLVALVVIAIVLLVNFVNPNDFRPQINQKLTEIAQQPVNIQGDIKWIFFPSLGVSVQDISVGDKADTQKMYAQLSAADVNLKLLPLLHKQAQVNSLRVNDLKLTLPASPADDGTNKPSPIAAAMKATGALFAVLPMLDLRELDVQRANITQLTATGDTDWTIKDFNLASKNLRANETFPVEMSLEFGKPATKFSAFINFSSQLNLDTRTQQISLKGTALSVKTPKTAPVNIDFAANIKGLLFDAVNHTASIAGFNGSFNQLSFKVNAKAENLDSAMTVSADISEQTQNLKAMLNALGIKLPATQSSAAFSSMSLTTHVDYQNNQLMLDPCVFVLDGNTFNIRAKSTDVSNMALQLSVQNSAFNASPYLPPANPAHQVQLQGLQLNLTALPPAGSDKNMMMSMLNGSLNLQKVTADQQVAQNILLKFDAKNGLFKLNQMHVNIWQGSVDGSANADLASPRLRWSVSPVVKNVQISNLAHLFVPKFEVSGVAAMSGTISSEGSDPAQIKRALNGKIIFDVKKGVMHGVDLNYWVRNGLALLHKEMPGNVPDTKQTPFGDLTGTLNINQGVVNNPDLLLQGDVLQVKGAGTADLVRESINYRLQMRKMADGDKTHNDVIPLIITGTFDAPKISIDMAMITKQIVDNQKERVMNKLGDQIGKKLGSSEVGQTIGQALNDSGVADSVGNAVGGALNSLLGSN